MKPKVTHYRLKIYPEGTNDDESYENGVEDMVIRLCEALAKMHSKGNRKRNIWHLVHKWLDYFLKETNNE